MIRILVCDDQAIIRDGLALMLNLERDMQVVGMAEDGHDAMVLMEQHTPDLVLMDLKMPGVNGVEATRQIRRQHPTTKILVLTTYDDDSWIFDAIRAGANGYLLKDTPREQLIAAIRGTIAGKAYVDPDIASKLLLRVASNQSQPATQITNKLTEREIDVLRLIAQGLSNSDIAKRIYLSEGTVRNHVSAILTKLNLADRTQAAVLAIQHGLAD
jgi:DNA-binding NarL/FixJ family response regulator